jgi:predicted nucleotidyltransferase
MWAVTGWGTIRSMSTSKVMQRLLERAAGDGAVLAVMLFGSRARGDASRASDVDVCLVLDPRAAADPSERLLAYADLDLDLSVFQMLPLAIRSRVLKEGKVLLGKDEDALYELAIRTAKQWEDFKPQHRRYLEAVLGD